MIAADCSAYAYARMHSVLNKNNNFSDFYEIPDCFMSKSFRSKGLALKKKITNMELGKYIFVITNNPYDIKSWSKNVPIRDINNLFIEYLKYNGLHKSLEEINVLLDNLIKLKDNFRNVAAHKELIDKNLADQCFKFLLEASVYFIDNFVKFFHC